MMRNIMEKNKAEAMSVWWELQWQFKIAQWIQGSLEGEMSQTRMEMNSGGREF